MSEASSVMPLDGYRVLDLSTMLTGPYCTRMLSDYGADVLKVEPREGDPSRAHGPFLNDDPGPEKSGLFLFLNTNKKSITVDLESQGGQEVIKKLVEQSSRGHSGRRPCVSSPVWPTFTGSATFSVWAPVMSP